MNEYDDIHDSCPVCKFRQDTPPRELNHLHPGTTLNGERYTVGTVVDYGGFGIIYRAWDNQMNMMVAVKEFFPTNYVNRNPGDKDIFIYESKRKEYAEGLDLFLTEAKITARLGSNPNIVRVSDSFTENGTAYMVMEYMTGKTLKKSLSEAGGRLPWETVREIGISISSILEEIHAMGMLHRDISPDNIMLCDNNVIKLFDFGAAKFPDRPDSPDRQIIMKIGYAPPEQYDNTAKQGPWTDIYALGATLYKCLTGIVPEESKDREAEIKDRQPDPLEHPVDFNEDIPAYLDCAVMKALDLDPAMRFQSASELRETLSSMKKVTLPSETRRLRSIIRTLVSTFLILILAGGAAGCFRYYTKQKQLQTLDGAAVSLWVCGNEKTRALFESMTEDFRKDYPGVALSISVYEKGDYIQQLRSSLSGENPAVLYENPDLDPGLPVSDLTSFCNDHFPASELLLKEQLLSGTPFIVPLGYRLGILWVNPSLMDADSWYTENNSRDDFLACRSAAYISDVSDYGKIQELLPALYRITPLKDSNVILSTSFPMSVNSEAESLDRAAAERLLSYLLSERAQDVLHIQNQTAFPILRADLRTYQTVNSEFSFVEDLTDLSSSAELIPENRLQKIYSERYAFLLPSQSEAEHFIKQQLEDN